MLRALVGALALILVSGHLASALHFSLVRHTVCAAHGELVHTEHTGHAEHDGHAGHIEQSTRSGDAAGVAFNPNVAHAEHGEHCSVLSRAANESAVCTPDSSSLGFGRSAAFDLASLAGHAPISILQVAPKQSPPV